MENKMSEESIVSNNSMSDIDLLTTLCETMSKGGDGGLTKSILDDVSENFVSINGKVSILLGEGLVPLSSQDKVKGVLVGFFRDRYSFNIEKGDLEILTNTLIPLNDFRGVSYSKNILLKNTTISFNRRRKNIHITRPLNIIQPTLPVTVTNEMKKDMISDYHEHFPELNKVLKFIVASNLSKDKKKTFMNLEFYSDFGKTTLAMCLERIGVAKRIDADLVYKKDASAVSPMDILDSMVVYIEEFKNFSDAMKTLDNTISIAPKFGMAIDIPLPAKIFLNATKSKSLSGAVGDELLNRLMLIERKSGGKLGEMPSIVKYGTAYFTDVLEDYMYRFISDEVERYRAFGDEHLARNEASSVLNQTYKEFKIIASKSVTTMNELATESIRYALDDSIGNPKIQRMDENTWLIASPKKTLLSLLQHHLDEDEYKRIEKQFSTVDNFFDLIDGVEVGSRFYRDVNGKKQSAISVKLKPVEDKEEVQFFIEDEVINKKEVEVLPVPAPRNIDILTDDTSNYHLWSDEERVAYQNLKGYKNE